MGRLPIIIDTDIGDDIDDTLATAFALNSEEFNVLGISVVYGDVETRAGIARHLLEAWGRGEVPVLEGAEFPLSGSYYPGTGPATCSQAELARVDLSADACQKRSDAWIVEQVMLQPGDVSIMTLGAMTNVAAALRLEPALAGKIRRIYSAGGNIDHPEEPEWNVRYDPEAAQVIARSGVPWTLVGSVLRNCHCITQAIAAWEEAGTARSAFILKSIALWRKNKSGTVPHLFDVGVFVAALDQEAVPAARGAIAILDDGTIEFAANANGPHERATGQVAAEFRERLLRQLAK